MKAKLFHQPLSIRKSPIHGYGVFADRAIEAGALIEECLLLFRKIRDAEYRDYYFTTGEQSVLPLGYGSIYNHADKPNANFSFDLRHGLLVVRANRFIEKGEEILIEYGEGWFSCRYQKVKLPLRYKLRQYKYSFKLLWRFLLVTALVFSYMGLIKTFFK